MTSPPSGTGPGRPHSVPGAIPGAGPPSGATGPAPPSGVPGATSLPSPSDGPGPAGPGPASTDASIGELLGSITEDFSTLVRQEVALAKAEINQTVTKVGKGAGMFGGAGVAGHFVLLFLSIALWWALGAMIGQGDAQPALGWAALIVAVIWAVVAAVLALMGRKNVQEAGGIPQTTQTVKRIPDALKGQEQ